MRDKGSLPTVLVFPSVIPDNIFSMRQEKLKFLESVITDLEVTFEKGFPKS